METTEKIDQDVADLHEELDRGEGKRHMHLPKRTKYIIGGVLLLLLMFLFGTLTRPVTQMVVVTEVPAVLDLRAPRVIQPELAARLSALYVASMQGGALIPTQVSTSPTPSPRILSWTPNAVGKHHGDNSPVALAGTYELPQGWFGVIRLMADKEEIGSSLVDSRTAQTGGVGAFSIIPASFTGERAIRLTLDAVKGCRLTCASTDQLCLATNVNYCTPLSDNQSFLSYVPVVAEALPPIGQCVTKTFFAGPKHVPQTPEDYTMCTRGPIGMWNTNVTADATSWLGSLHDRVSEENRKEFFQSAGKQFVQKKYIDGSVGNLEWSFNELEGDANTKTMCSMILTMKVDCAGTGAKQTSIIDPTLQGMKSFATTLYSGLLALTMPQTAYAGDCIVAGSVYIDGTMYIEYGADADSNGSSWPPFCAIDQLECDGIYDGLMSDWAAYSPSLIRSYDEFGTMCPQPPPPPPLGPQLGVYDYDAASITHTSAFTKTVNLGAPTYPVGHPRHPQVALYFGIVNPGSVDSTYLTTVVSGPGFFVMSCGDGPGLGSKPGTALWGIGSASGCVIGFDPTLTGGNVNQTGVIHFTNTTSGATGENPIVLTINHDGTPPPPIAGVCGVSNNACSLGTLNDVADSATDYFWDCIGPNGGSTDNCSAPIPPGAVDGVCGAPKNTCAPGTFNNIPDSSTEYLWNCDGLNGGLLASCSAPIPPPVINGICGVSNNDCLSGILANIPDSSTEYLWNCDGLNGGLLASCSAPIPSFPSTVVYGSCGSIIGDILPTEGWEGTGPGGSNWGGASLACPSGVLAGLSGGRGYDGAWFYPPFTWDCAGSMGGDTAHCCQELGGPGGGVYKFLTSGPASSNPGDPGCYEGGPCGPVGSVCVSAPYDVGIPWQAAGICEATPSCDFIPPTPSPTPDLTIDGDIVNFGPVPVDATGVAGSTRVISITNNGEAGFSGTIGFPATNGTYESYSCFGGYGVTVPPLTTVEKTCTIKTTLNDLLGGNAHMTNGVYTKNFTVTATALTNSRLNVIDFTPGTPVTVGYPTIDLGTLSPSASAVSHDFLISNSGSSLMDFEVSVVGGPAGYTITDYTNSMAPVPGCSGTNIANGALDRVCRVTFDPGDAGVGDDQDATIRFDNKSNPNTPPDPLDVSFTVDVVAGSIGGFECSSCPPPDVTGPIGENYTIAFGAHPISPPAPAIVKSFGITNTGDQPLIFSCDNLTGPNFYTSGCAGIGNDITIPPLTGVHPITVTFAPKFESVPSVGLVIDGNAANFPPSGDMTLTLSGSGISGPALTVTPGTGAPIPWGGLGGYIGFSDQAVNAGPSSPPKIIRIDNSGGSPATVNLAVGNPMFTVTPVAGNVIPGNDSRNFNVRFDPDAPPDIHSGTITITADIPGSTQIGVGGEGVADVPILLLIPPSPIDFDKVIIPKTKTITLSITNKDVRDFGFPTLEFVGADKGAFTCPECDDAGVPLDVDDSRIVNISFVPTELKDYGNVVLKFVGGDPAIDGHTIDINASGARPTIRYEEN